MRIIATKNANEKSNKEMDVNVISCGAAKWKSSLKQRREKKRINFVKYNQDALKLNGRVSIQPIWISISIYYCAGGQLLRTSFQWFPYWPFYFILSFSWCCCCIPNHGREHGHRYRRRHCRCHFPFNIPLTCAN